MSFASDFSASAPRLAGRFSIDPLYNASTHLHEVAVITLSTPPGAAPARLSALGRVSELMR